MKRKVSFLLAAALATAGYSSQAQEPAPPQPPQPPVAPGAAQPPSAPNPPPPPLPSGDGRPGRERAERGGGGPRPPMEEGRPGERGNGNGNNRGREPRPEGARDGARDGQRPDGGRGENGRPDGPRGGDGPRSESQPRPEGGRGESGRLDGPRNGESRRGEGLGEHAGPGEHGGPALLAAPRTPQPFLGVMAGAVPPPMGAQLGLKEGFGLLVMEVLPNSPAATAGVQKFDVLKMLNDQQLVDPAQLATLVRGAGKDAEVSLTLLREAKEQKVTVKVGEHVAPLRPGLPALGGRSGEGQGLMPLWHGPEALRDRVREFHEQRLRNQGPGGGAPGPGAGGEPRPGGMPMPPARPPSASSSGEANGREHEETTAAVSPEELLRQAQTGSGTQIQVNTENGVTTLEGGQARFQFKDKDGEIEVTGSKGSRKLTARDAKGEVVFSGSVDTDEQRRAVPEVVRRKLAGIHLRPQVQAFVEQSAAGSRSASSSSPSSGEAGTLEVQ